MSSAPRMSGSLVAVGAVTLAAVSLGAWLGLWQWSRAYAKAEVVFEAAPMPIAEVLAPASSTSGALGRNVSVTGRFGDGLAVVTERNVEGQDAVLFVREFMVDSNSTGTGEPATLAVLVGWQPTAADHAGPSGASLQVTIEGYLRVSEAPMASSVAVQEPRPDGAFLTTAVSTAELAQRWEPPMYSAVLVAHDGSTRWMPMPPREPESRLNWQSAVYAIEWWLFGAFALVVSARWMRDNSRAQSEQAEEAGHG